MISEMAINNTLIDAVIEILNIKAGMMSYKLKMKDVQYIRSETREVTLNQIKTFLFELTKHQNLTRNQIIHAFLAGHNNGEVITKADTSDTVYQENAQRADAQLKEIPSQAQEAHAPSLDDLLTSSSVIVGE